MLRFFLFSAFDSLDGADAAALFDTAPVGTTLNAKTELSRAFPAATLVVVPFSELVDTLRSGEVDYAVRGYLSSFQEDASALEASGALNSTVFAYEITPEGEVRSVDPAALLPDAPSLGPDVLVGTDGDDILHASHGWDTLYGMAGDDILFGEQNSDVLWGGDGNDKLRGGALDDRLIGGPGNDVLDGGIKIDVADYSSHGSVTVDLAITSYQQTGVGWDKLVRIENVIGGSEASRLFGDEGRNVLTGGAGNDALYGRGWSDELIGGEGDDLLSGGRGGDYLIGGEGNDTLRGGVDNDTLIDREHPWIPITSDDRLFGNRGDDFLDAGYGNDWLSGGKGDDDLRGDRGDDVLRGNGGNDRLYAGMGDDILMGGRGNDRLYGNFGKQTMTGGKGVDEFLFYSSIGHNVITDFRPGIETIWISEKYRDLIIEGDVDTIIRVDNDTEFSITLLGVSPDDLSRSDFFFM
ncbi:calcium-binding protein [Tropicimonas sediminicola]|uniref:Hemolysin-type calcium-binding repeat-containing protein n=1 Tax=Tropicimonas sediminicola TaxID=1031541 RepID=A0A239CNZ2_9RHOB|nr:calcium-binding protein [Tropicimonas sediminicola]SNS21860.1 Hemolysin-type calcium-binding repeat-containing protein [Tropicimonas sediminicola]